MQTIGTLNIKHHHIHARTHAHSHARTHAAHTRTHARTHVRTYARTHAHCHTSTHTPHRSKGVCVPGVPRGIHDGLVRMHETCIQCNYSVSTAVDHRPCHILSYHHMRITLNTKFAYTGQVSDKGKVSKAIGTDGAYPTEMSLLFECSDVMYRCSFLFFCSIVQLKK